MNLLSPISAPLSSVPAPIEETPPGTEILGNRIDLMQIYVIIRRNLVLIGSALLIALTLGVVVTMLTTPRYVASSSIQIDQESDRILNTQDLQPAASYQDTERFLQTQVDVIGSTALAERVGQSLGLIGNPKFFQQMRTKLPAPRAGIVRDRQIREASIELIRKNLGVNLPKQSRLVVISFSSPDPVLAAKVANTYARGFIDYNIERKYDSSSYARSFLSKQLAQAKDKLEDSERQLNGYARQAGLIKTADTMTGGKDEKTTQTGSVTTQSLVQLNEALNVAKTNRIAAERKWQSASSVPVMNLPDVLSNQSINILVQQRAQKQAELNDALTLHKDAYPQVQTLRAQVTELDRQINAVANSIKNSVHDNYRVAAEQENSLASQVASLKGQTLAEQDRGVRYNILAREADTNRTLYEGLLQRFKEVSAAAGIAQNNISIIDEAQPPVTPSSPKLAVNLTLALLAGLAISAGLIFVREQIDDAVRNPQDVESKLGLNLLGIVPKIGKGESMMELLSQPRTNVSEAYNALRTSLLYSSHEGHPRTVLVTSSQPSEGKSTTSYALASSLARLGLRVVLVDTDLRRPSLHKLTGASNARGLSSVLSRQAELREVINGLTDSDTTLSFVPAGPIPPSPTELLGSAGMREVISDLASGFDIVILDGPPVLGLADSPILASMADGTMFVVEADRNRRGGTKSALRRLTSARAKIIGVVLTKFDAKKAGGEYYGADAYYYYGKDSVIEAPATGGNWIGRA